MTKEWICNPITGQIVADFDMDWPDHAKIEQIKWLALHGFMRDAIRLDIQCFKMIS